MAMRFPFRRHAPDPAANPEPPSLPAAPLLGLRDAQLRGWFQNDSGELFRGFDVRPEDVVLDAGCGDGGNAAFCGRQGAHVVLADIDPGCIDAARQRLNETRARRTEAFVTDCDPIPLPDSYATRVVCTEVLEHVPDPGRMMAELVRVARPCALYLLTVPDPAAEAIQRSLAPETYWREPNHVRVFEREAFTTLVQSSGLTIESRSSYGFFQNIWWTMFWTCGTPLEAPPHPVLENWARTWNAMLDTPGGPRPSTLWTMRCQKASSSSQGSLSTSRACGWVADRPS